MHRHAGYSPFPPIKRRKNPRRNLGARTQTILTLIAILPSFSTPSQKPFS